MSEHPRLRNNATFDIRIGPAASLCPRCDSRARIVTQVLSSTLVSKQRIPRPTLHIGGSHRGRFVVQKRKRSGLVRQAGDGRLTVARHAIVGRPTATAGLWIDFPEAPVVYKI